MKNNNSFFRIRFFASIFLLIAATSFANAALLSRLNGQAVYDADLNISWLTDAN